MAGNLFTPDQGGIPLRRLPVQEAQKEPEYSGFSTGETRRELIDPNQIVPLKVDAPEVKAAPTSRTWGEAASDTVMSFGAGSGKLVEGLGALYGLATGNMDNGVRKFGAETADWYGQRKSEFLKQLEQNRSEKVKAADGVIDSAGTAIAETVKNPALLGGLLTEQVPNLAAMGGAGAVVGGLGKAGQVATAIGTGATLQGSDVGGETYDALMNLKPAVWEAHPDFRKLVADGVRPSEAKHQIVLSLGRKAGSAAAAISLFVNALPGGSIIEKALVGQAAKKVGARGVAGGMVKGGLGEMTSEGLEEGGGGFVSNVAKREVNPNQSLTEGVGEKAGLGMIGGLGMGAPAGAAGGMARPDQTLQSGSTGEFSPAVDGQLALPAPARNDFPMLEGPGGDPRIAGPVTKSEWTIVDGVALPPSESRGQPNPDAVPPLLGVNPMDSEFMVDSRGNATAAPRAFQVEADARRQEAVNTGLTPDVAQAQLDAATPKIVLSKYDAPFMLRTVAEREAERLSGKVIPADGGGYVVAVSNKTPDSMLARPVPKESRQAKLANENPFLAFIFGAGIQPSELSDIGVDAPGKKRDGKSVRYMRSGFPPLFRKTGLSMDGLQEAAVQGGFLTREDAASGAGHEMIRGMIREALGGQKIVPAHQVDAEASRAFQENVSLENEKWVMKQAQALDLDTSGSIEDIAKAVEVETARRDAVLVDSANQMLADASVEDAIASAIESVGLDADPATVDDVARITIAQEIDERAVERAAMQAEDDTEFLQRIEEIIRGNKPNTQTIARGGEQSPAGSEGQASGETGGGQDSVLQSYTPEEVTAKHDAVAAAEKAKSDAEQKAVVDSQVDKFALTGSDLEADQAAAAGQQNLLDRPNPEPKAEPKAAEPVQEKKAVGPLVETFKGKYGQGLGLPQARDALGKLQKDRPELDWVPVESDSHGGRYVIEGRKKLKPIDAAAHEAATSPKNDKPVPTDAMKEAGNYAKGHVSIAGLDISIENPAGSKRRPEWPTLKHHYGYFKGTVSADGDHIDTFIRPGTPTDFKGNVFVVNQNHKDGTFDEHKVMLGFSNALMAKMAYLSNYTKGWKGLGSMATVPMDEFKGWLKDGNTKKPFPVAEKSDGEGAPPLVPAKPQGTVARAEAALADKADAVAGSEGPKSKILDFGEKIEGARKDAEGRIRRVFGEAVTQNRFMVEPFSKLWPLLDYQALVDAGTDAKSVGMMRAFREEIPPKPRKPYLVKQWAEVASILHGALVKGMSDPDWASKIESTLEKYPSIADSVMARAGIYAQAGHAVSVEGYRSVPLLPNIVKGKFVVDLEKPYRVVKLSGLSRDLPRVIGEGETRQKAIDAAAKYVSGKQGATASPSAKQSRFTVYSYRAKPGKFYAGKKVGKGYIDLKEFASTKEALAFMDSQEGIDELTRLLEQAKFIPSERREENRPRIGVDHRNGKDVSPEMFQDAFGFRGVQFGNYVEKGRRQEDLNNAFDALHDMALLLGLPTKAISLNGSLGLAFGARGGPTKGMLVKASAHYEPDQVVINLTKTNGAGSLAHEWWHALDNHFAAKDGLPHSYATETAKARMSPEIRKEMRNAFGAVAAMVNGSQMDKRSQDLDSYRSKPYWSTTLEMTARAFEQYIISAAQEVGKVNDYLANVVDEKLWEAIQKMESAFLGKAMKPYPYATDAEMPAVKAAFNDFFATIQTKETDNGIALFEPLPNNQGYEKDLFGNPVQASKGKTRRPQSEKGPESRDTLPGPGLQDTKAPPGEYFAKTVLGEPTTRKIGARFVRSVDDLAVATSYLYKSAVERMDVIVTDESGKVIAIVGSFKGTVNQASVYPDAVMAEIVRVPGAKNAWLSHNHPSGAADLSPADKRLLGVFRAKFRDIGINIGGIVAVSAGRYGYLDADGNEGVLTADRSKESVEIPVVEREIVDDPGSRILVSSPDAAEGFARAAIKRSGPGVILMDASHKIAGFLPVSESGTKTLRGTDDARLIARAASEANASYAIIIHDDRLSRENSRNLAGALNAMFVSVLDIIDVGKVTTRSASRDGEIFPDRAMFSRGEGIRNKRPDTSNLFGQRVISKSVADAVAKRFETAFPNAPKVEVGGLADVAKRLGIDIPSDVEGMHFRGKTYLFPENLTSESRAEFVALHEGVHAGLRNLLGPKLDAALRDLWSANMGLQLKASKVLKANSDIKGFTRERAVEEVLADMGQAATKLKGWDKFVSWFRQALRDLGFTIKLSDGDILSLVAKSLDSMKGDNSKPSFMANPAFMRGANARDALAADFKAQTGDDIGKAGTKLAGVEIRNNQRKAGNPAGATKTLDMEQSPYTDAQIAMVDSWEKMGAKSSKYLFHTTPAKNLDSIAREGLMPGKAARYEGVSGEGKVSLSANEEASRYYGGKEDVMLRVSKDYKFDDLGTDLLGGDGTYTTGKAIPPDALEVKRGGKWVPLRGINSGMAANKGAAGNTSSGRSAGSVSTGGPRVEPFTVSGVGDDLVTLYHGTSKESADAIRQEGKINAGVQYPGSKRGVSLTPRKSIAEDYAGPDGEVLRVDVPKSSLNVDLESNDNPDIDEAIDSGSSVWANGDLYLGEEFAPKSEQSSPNSQGESKFSRSGTIDIDGKPRSRTNSKGQPIAGTDEGIRNFWKWFSPSATQLLDGLSVSSVSRLKSDSKALSDFSESQSRLSERDRFTVIPPAMFFHVANSVSDAKILDTVVRSLPIDVVNFFRSKKLSPEVVLKNESMLKDVFAIDPTSDVSLGVNPSRIAELTFRVVANAGAKITGMTGGSFERNAAILAAADDPVLGAHVRKSAGGDLGILAGFGDSKVVDADGRPLVVYHGSPDLRFVNEDGTFKSPKARYGWGEAGGAHWFTPSEATARSYADPMRAFDYQNAEEGVISAYIKLENPLAVDGRGRNWRDAQRRGKTSDVIDESRGAGHDGSIIRNVKDDYNNNVGTRPTDTYVVFESSQIKSATSNNGAFDGQNPDIRFSRAEREATINPGESLGRPNGLKNRMKAMVDWVDNRTDVLSALPDRTDYLRRRYLTLGRIAKVDEIAKGIREAFMDATDADKKAIYNFMTTAGVRADGISQGLRQAAIDTKANIKAVGDKLVAVGLLDDAAREQFRDAYLPRIYLKHLLSEGDFRALGSGKKPSSMGYLKARKDLPKELREVILGEIKDPAFLSAMAIVTPMRDVALLDFMDQISGNTKWVADNSAIWFNGKFDKRAIDKALDGKRGVLASIKANEGNVRAGFLERIESEARAAGSTDDLMKRMNRIERHLDAEHFPELKDIQSVFRAIDTIKATSAQRVTPFWLKAEAERLRDQARYMENRADAKKAEDLAKAMDDAAAPALEALKISDTKDYKQIPDSPRYGRLRGLMVRKEIHEDIVGVYDIMPENPNIVQSVFGFGGAGTKAVQWWKVGKVTLNPGSQIRNGISNMVMLQLSGVPMHMVLPRIVQAIKSIQSGGKHWQVAKKYGVTEATFSAQELAEIKKDAIKMQMESMGQSRMKRFGLAAMLMAHPIVEKAGKAYQFMEQVGKTAKIIDVMEREGKADWEAALEAQKWMFDYSLVPNAIRYARNAPIGSPFATWLWKSSPRLLEIAALHPQRLIPWVGLFAALPYIAAMAVGGDPEDWKKVKELMPEAMRKRGHIAAVPFRDENGKIQFADYGPFVPWTLWSDFALNMGRGEVGTATADLAGNIFGGGPLFSVLATLSTGGVDPFTDRQVFQKGDPAMRQALSWMNYAWTLAMPPVITDQGFAGKMYRAAAGETDKFGDERASMMSATTSLLGLNMYGVDPDHMIAKESQKMFREILDVKNRLKSRMSDQSLSDSQREKLVKEYFEDARRRQEKLMEYQGRGNISPELAPKVPK